MKTRLLSILCILLMSLGIQAHNLEPLHVDGRYLKNSKGDIVTLHGFETAYDPYDDPGFVHWIRGDWETCLRYKQTALDSMLAVGWKFDYVRLMINNPGELENLPLGSYKKYFEEVMIPMIDFFHSRNIYTLLWGIAPGEAQHFEMGDDFQQQSFLFWDYVSNHPHIKNNPGVMFELFNEPDEPSEKYDDPGKAWTDYVQPLVDKIRSHSDNVIFVPMIPQARNGFAEYPLKGSNIGYQFHFYPGWDFGQGIENNWDKDGGQLFLSNTAPLILTETSWDEKISSLGVGNTTTFGRPLKDVIDKYGNVSWNPYAGNEIAFVWVRRPSEIGKLTWWDDPEIWVEQIPVDWWFHYDPEACLIPLFDWFEEYQKTNIIPASQFKAITVTPKLVPTQMEQGEFYAMKIIAEFTNGLNWNVAGDAVYTVSDPSVLAINHGNIRALQEGMADITATYTDGTGQTFNCQFQIVVTPATDTKTNQVFADSKAIWYGDETPALTYTTLNPNLSGTPQLSTTATSTSSVGIYPIAISKGTTADQQVNYVDGEFCVLPAPLDVSVSDITINEGDTPIPSFTYSGFRNGDSEEAVITKRPVLSAYLRHPNSINKTTQYISNLPAGSYVIFGTDGEAANYELCSNVATLTIKEAIIEGTDMTNRIGMLPNDWHVNDVAYYSSPVKSSDGREESMVQTYEETVENVGEQMWQEIGDLPNGDYVVEVYANAVYTPDRGFESSVIEGAEDVAYVEANGQRTYLHTRINGEILPWSDFYRIYTSVTDGTLRIALVVEKPGTNWHTIQIKRLVKLPDYNITANNITMVYGDEIPELTYTTEGWEPEGTPKLSTTATKTSPVGTYPIKVEKGTVTNEKVTYVEGTLTITPAPLTVGVQDVTITEGDAIPSFTLTYSGFKNGDTESNAFTLKPTATTTATSSSKPGTYPITVSGGEAKNYALTYTKGTLTIKEMPVTITANDLTMVYGDDMPTLTYSSEGGGLKGTPKLSTTATKTSPVGTYPITVEKGTVTNEKVTYVEGTLTIIQAPLTVGVQDVMITEGDAIPSFTLTYSGFRNSDTEANAFSKKPTATTTATASSKPGTYPITVSGGSATNYALTYTQGTLTIKEKPVTITANEISMVYGDEVPTLTYSTEGGTLKGTPKLSTTATKTSPIGTYPIKVERGTVTNEQVTFVDGTLIISKAPLTIGVKDETITEGDSIPTFTLIYDGWRNGDTEATAFTRKPKAKTTATSESKAGTYPITITVGTAKNYKISYQEGTLTIEPAAGIEGVYADGQGNAVIYNVNGQKLSKPKKGINIIGGKKVVVK